MTTDIDVNGDAPGLIHRLRRVFGQRNGDAAVSGDPVEIARTNLLQRIESFDGLRVEDVMVPRADIVAIEVNTPLVEAAAIFAEAAHSRLPLYRETLDDPMGMVHLKDLVTPLVAKLSDDAPETDEPTPVLERLRRELLYVPPSAPVSDLLLRMQTTRIHMALVIDEYGGTDGLVTIEDLIEEIVGDIEDEHDEEAPQLVRRPSGVFIADARLEIETFESASGAQLAEPDWADVDTLGGLVFSLVGRVPARGEIIRHPNGWEFEVDDADARRIKRLKIRPTPEADAPQPA